LISLCMSCVSRAAERLRTTDWLPDKAFSISARLLKLFDDGSSCVEPPTIEFLLIKTELGNGYNFRLEKYILIKTFSFLMKQF